MNLEMFAVAHREPDVKVPDGISLIGTSGFQARLTDNTGVHISDKNPRWSELTAIYWLLKNHDLQASHVGICHYRRYLASYSLTENMRRHRGGLPFGMIKPADFGSLRDHLSSDKILQLMKKLRADILVPEPYVSAMSVRDTFAHYHKSAASDFDLTFQIAIKKNYFSESFANWFLTRREMHPCNMSVLPTDLFVQIWTAMFDILLELEPYVLEKESDYQNRTFAFIAERLFSALLFWRIHQTRSCPIARVCSMVMVDES